MADENKKAQKKAEKELEKAKKERIKQSKPKKEGNVFTRMWAAIKKFFKGFTGTCKKVIWPDRKTVLKNSAIVFVCIAVLAVIIGLLDWGLMGSVRLAEKGIENAKTSHSEEASTNADSANSITVDTSGEKTSQADAG